MKCLSGLVRILFPALLVILVFTSTSKLAWALAQTDSDTDEQALAPLKSIAHSGPQVQLDQQRARLAGLQTLTLHSSNYSQQHLVSASVINPLPLLTLKLQISNVKQARKLSQQQLALTQQSLQRAQQLRDTGIGNQKRVTTLQTELLTRQTAAQQINNNLLQLKLQCLQQWGEILAKQIEDPSSFVDTLESGKQVLLLITLPAGIHLSDNINTMTVRPAGDKTSGFIAKLVSASPSGSPGSTGATYFFHAPKHPTFRLGAVFDGWIKTNTETQQGFMIPDSAIIWHAGQAWAYIEIAPFQYLRRAVENPLTIDQHWFVSTGFSAGEKLVTQGAALLLSEEFRWQIPEEDEEDDE